MKVLAAHNLLGDIEHFVVLPADAPPAAVGVAQGHLMTEVDASGLRVDAKKPETLEKLAETIRSYRVEVKEQGRLVKKKS
jgi:hypothetical protein